MWAQTAEAELESIYASAPIGLCTLTPEGRYIRINSRLAEINGLPISAHLGKAVAEILPGLAPQAEKVLAQVKVTREPVIGVEFSGTTHAQPGVLRYWQTNWSPIKDASGKVVAINVVAEEITARREADKKLAEQQALIESIISANPALTYVFDISSGKNVFVSAQIEEMLGYSAHEVKSLGSALIPTLIHPDDFVRVQQHFSTLSSGEVGAIAEFEYRMKHRDGSWRWILSRDRILRKPDNNLALELLGVAFDVTERKHEERRQKYYDDLLRATQTLAGSEDIQAAAARLLGEYLGASRVGYAEDFGDGDTVSVPQNYVAGVTDLKGNYSYADYGHQLLAKMRSGELHVHQNINDSVDLSQEAKKSYKILDVNAVADCPILRDGTLTNVLFVHFKAAHRFTEDELIVIQETANLTWEAVQRSRAEAKLKRSEARLAGVFDSNLFGFTIFDADSGQTIAINDCFLKMTQHTRADFDEGRWDWREFTPPEYFHLDVDAVHQAKENGYWAPFEKEYERKDGSRFWARVSSAPLPGEPGRVVVSIQDISSERAAQADLRNSEQRLQLAKIAAGIGVWDWNLRTNAIEWSPEMFELLDVPADTPPGDLFATWIERLHPYDRAGAIETSRRGAEEGQNFSMDVRIQRRDGEVRWIRSQATCVIAPDGNPARLTGVNLDVTAERLLQEQLLERAERLASEAEQRTIERNRLFELSSDLFASAGFDGYLKEINPAWQEILGYTEAELLARPLIEIVHPADHMEATKVIAALKQGQRLQRFEDRLITKSGESVWIAWAAVPDKENFYAVGRDVTKERHREEALRQSQKMEAVGQLTGGIAHDFNNLLGAVVGGFDLIRRNPVDPERVRRIAENGLAAAERGAKLTAQLLAFSKSQRLELKPIIVVDIVSGMAELLQRTLGPMIRVKQELMSGRSMVLSDPTQLEMAVLNLAINARDAMPDGGELAIRSELVTLSGDNDLADGDYVALSVRDTGIGMAGETVTRAFDPFFTTKGIGKGTGLGLSQVYGIAKQAGGVARISSTPNAGTTVTLILPVTQSRDDAQILTLANERHAVGRSERILLIDDDNNVRQMTAALLEELGYRVEEAADGEKGIAVFSANAPDLVLVDFAMPGMNGAEVASKLREQQSDVPIVFISGYADTAAIERISGSSSTMLRKPFRIEDLAVAVRSALERRNWNFS